MAEVSFEELEYHSGFGNHFRSEAVKGALPQDQNSPLECPYGLYAEQLSGTPFTAPRSSNRRSWFYRIKPSVGHEPFHVFEANASCLLRRHDQLVTTPTQLRWKPLDFPDPKASVDFIRGLYTICAAGSASLRHGYAIHLFSATESMRNCALVNADGDFLFVPQQGRLWIKTEFGRMEINPGEVAVIQLGMRFSVELPDGPSRGYALEVFDGHFQLPELGLIGANGLADPRHFQVPMAWFEDHCNQDFLIVQKYGGNLFSAKQDYSPFNVVAWHGNYTPYKYDLSKFCPVNTVLFDHADPSINTVLTVPSERPGVALVDFVIFPPRWSVAEHTFRPPYFHRNCMNEFMGLIFGSYEAKAEGFLPGGASLHTCMTPHGVDAATYEATVSETDQKPAKLSSASLAFMFETYLSPGVTQWALTSPKLDTDYSNCWRGMASRFSLHQKTLVNSTLL